MRKGQRSRALKSGKILLPAGGVIDCTIRDLSETGVKLKLAEAAPLPERFELLTVSSGLIAPVERRWQKGTEAGVSIVGPPRQLEKR